MSNDKAEKRKRKLAERARRERSDALRAARRAEYPEFDFDLRFSDPDFADVVRGAVKHFDFSTLPAIEQRAYRTMRAEGASRALATLQAEMDQLRSRQPKNPAGHFADVGWVITMGEAIFANIPSSDRRRLFPFNDFRILFHGNRLTVQCTSLARARTSKGTAYHSRFKPTVVIAGREYIVAFAPHVIERIQARLSGDSRTWAGLGDVYPYFELCNHFEPANLNGDQDRHVGSLGAITFFDDASAEDMRFSRHRYVSEVLGSTYDIAKGKPYYRVGYCPVVADGDFAVALTFLPPGFKQTPEHAAIRRSRLSDVERAQLSEVVTDDHALVKLHEHGDFSAVRWFHENGVPQVVQTHEDWFRPYGA